MKDTPKKRSRSGPIAALVAFAVLVAYPLSIGPAERVVFHGHYMSLDTLRIAYWPIWWARGKCDPLGAALYRYCLLWSDRVVQWTDPRYPDTQRQ